MYCSNVISNSMFCVPIVDSELITFINNVNSNKAAGPDNIGRKLLKEVAPCIITPLLHIFNLSFSTGIVPDSLKIAKVIPVFKTGDQSLLQNYRPISLLSLFHKILEKLMANRLTKFIAANSLLNDYQFGFRKHHSTTLVVIDVIDNIYSHLDNKEYVLGIYLDPHKAFDTVDHSILLWKLNHYGIRGVVHSWFTSYLENI